jgi:hypothetical protein
MRGSARTLLRVLPLVVIAGLAVLVALTVMVTLAEPALAFAQQPAKPDQDYLIGIWRLDLLRSRYSPGPPPKSETRTYTRDEEGLKGVVDRHLADGREEMIEYRANFDQEYPVSGTDAYDAVTFKRIDARTAQAVLSHAGQVFGIARRVISEDGQTMTITFRREASTVVNNVAVYRKDPKR